MQKWGSRSGAVLDGDRYGGEEQGVWDAPAVMGARCPEVGEAGELGLGQKHQSFNSR